MRTYICPNCGDVKNFGGLCRDCTEYGEAGEVLKPIRRVKNTGHVHIQMKIVITTMTIKKGFKFPTIRSLDEPFKIS